MLFDYEALEKWQQEDPTRRAFEIKVTPNDQVVWVSIYGVSGKHIKPGDPIPTAEDLIADFQRKIDQDLKRLEAYNAKSIHP